MKTLVDQRSTMTGKLGDEFNRLWDAVRSLQPVDGPHLRFEHTTRGVNWRPKASLLTRLNQGGDSQSADQHGCRGHVVLHGH